MTDLGPAGVNRSPEFDGTLGACTAGCWHRCVLKNSYRDCPNYTAAEQTLMLDEPAPSLPTQEAALPQAGAEDYKRAALEAQRRSAAMRYMRATGNAVPLSPESETGSDAEPVQQPVQAFQDEIAVRMTDKLQDEREAGAMKDPRDDLQIPPTPASQARQVVEEPQVSAEDIRAAKMLMDGFELSPTLRPLSARIPSTPDPVHAKAAVADRIEQVMSALDGNTKRLQAANEELGRAVEEAESLQTQLASLKDGLALLQG